MRIVRLGNKNASPPSGQPPPAALIRPNRIESEGAYETEQFGIKRSGEDCGAWHSSASRIHRIRKQQGNSADSGESRSQRPTACPWRVSITLGRFGVECRSEFHEGQKGSSQNDGESYNSRPSFGLRFRCRRSCQWQSCRI